MYPICCIRTRIFLFTLADMQISNFLSKSLSTQFAADEKSMAQRRIGLAQCGYPFHIVKRI